MIISQGLARSFTTKRFQNVQIRNSHSLQTNFKMGPAARLLLIKHNITDISELKPSGPRKTILNTDVQNFIANFQKTATKQPPKQPIATTNQQPPLTTQKLSSPPPSPQAVQSFSYTDEPNSQVRKVIAKRLSESKYSIPHYYVSVDCEIDSLLAIRKEYNELTGLKISVNDFIVKAVAESYHQARKFSTQDGVDVSVAVASDRGLITPIVRSANHKNVNIISGIIKDLVDRAKSGKLAPEEFQGGHITISNLGMFGISSFSAIINPPQGIIVAVGSGEKKVVVKEDADGNLVPSVGTVMSVTLSADNRSLQENEVAEFLKLLQSKLNHPLSPIN